MKTSELFGIFLVLILAGCTSASSEEVEKRLIQTSEHEPPTWLTYDEIFDLINNDIRFMDVTGRNYPAVKPLTPNRKALPVELRYQSVVRDVMAKVSTSRIETFMENMTSFYNRYYISQWGVESSDWILAQARELILSTGYGGKASATRFTHSFAQSSVVVTIWGSDPELIGEVVVLGGHQDTVVSGGTNGTEFNRQPGGDDNASGSGALFEALRAILESGFVPKRTLEFHWYAAEEMGLLGSQDIAQAYTNLGVNVISMLNFDVVGYYVEGRDDIKVVDDFTDPSLNELLRLAIVEYLNTTWYNWSCNYACSDHASWDRVGIPAASPFEPVGSHHAHTIGDTLEIVSFNQIAQFSRLAVAYAIEISEPTN